MRSFLFVFAVVALAGCALRPRYAEFIGKETKDPVRLQLLQTNSEQAVPNALVEVGETRSKVSLRTDAQGYFTLPVDKRFIDDNALIVVTAPPGVGRTKVVLAPMGTLEAAPAVVKDSQPLPETIEVVDAGTSTY